MVRTDLLVIGGGAIGVEAARHAASLGAHVTLIERGVPSATRRRETTALLGFAAAGRAVARVREARAAGLDPHEASFKYTRVADAVRRLCAEGEADATESLARAGIEVVQGEARFTAPLAIAVLRRAFDPRRVLVATGTVPREPRAAGATSAEELARSPALPRSLAVIATEPEHLAFAQGLARLGAHVIVVCESWPFGGPGSNLGAQLRGLLESDGVVVLAPARVESAREDGHERVLGVAAPEGRVELRVSAVVAEPARAADVAALHAGQAGIGGGPSGLEVDERFRTAAAGTYAAGGVVRPGIPFRLARYQARFAVEVALGETRGACRPETVPEVVPTDPELARVGGAEMGPEARHEDVMSASVPVPREPCDAVASPFGQMRVVGDREGKIIGVEAVCREAGAILESLGLALRTGGSLEELGGLAGSAALETLAVAADTLRGRRRASVWKRLTSKLETR